MDDRQIKRDEIIIFWFLLSNPCLLIFKRAYREKKEREAAVDHQTLRNTLAASPFLVSILKERARDRKE